MSIRQLFVCSCVLLLTAGCVPATHYTWNNYDDKLYQHYKNPVESELFIEHLKGIIEQGEKTNKVPPGIYAEYGYTLYEKGGFQEAANNFKLERDKWPESKVLMTKMIQIAEKRARKDTSQSKGAVSSNPAPATAGNPKDEGASK